MKLVKAHGNAELGKWPRKPKESKWTKGAQEEINGTQELASNVIKSPMTMLSHLEKNRQQGQRSLAGLGQMTS